MKDATSPQGVLIRIDTNAGPIEAVIHVDRAPLSSAAFLRHVDEGNLASSGIIYRAVRKDDNDAVEPRIDVIQGGIAHPGASQEAIPHESTRQTGLRHEDGALSLPRAAYGQAKGTSFFICIGDQAALDAGGARCADGEGFAVFGKVTAGMDVVRKIHGLPTTGVTANAHMQGQMLDPPIRILSAMRAGAM